MTNVIFSHYTKGELIYVQSLARLIIPLFDYIHFYNLTFCEIKKAWQSDIRNTEFFIS